MLKRRSKFLEFADRSKSDRSTVSVKGCLSDDLPSNSENEKRIFRCERRVVEALLVVGPDFLVSRFPKEVKSSLQVSLYLTELAERAVSECPLCFRY